MIRTTVHLDLYIKFRFNVGLDNPVQYTIPYFSASHYLGKAEPLLYHYDERGYEQARFFQPLIYLPNHREVYMALYTQGYEDK